MREKPTKWRVEYESTKGVTKQVIVTKMYDRMFKECKDGFIIFATKEGLCNIIPFNKVQFIEEIVE